MSVRNVTGTIINPTTDLPWVGVEVKFALNSSGVTLAPPGIYPPTSVVATTITGGVLGAAGIGVPLWANAEGLSTTIWNVSIGGKYAFSFQLPAGAGAIDLSALRVAGLTTLEPGDPLIALIAQMIEDADPGEAGGGAWGDITGTLSDQVDLQVALDTETADRSAADTAEATARADADLLLAPKDSPALTGTPTAPTAANATNTTQIATTAFVKALLTELIGTAPANLDTLQEIAAQLATDESAVAALITAVSLKANISSLAAVAFSGLKADVGLGNVDNIADASKPVSTAQAAAIALKSNLAGGAAFTGGVQVDTLGVGTAPSVSGNARANYFISAAGGFLAGSVGAYTAGIYNNALALASTRQLVWGTAGDITSGSYDLGIKRSAAGVLEVNNGTAGTLRDLMARSVRGAAVSFGSAPATPVEGMLVAFTDSSTATPGATITAGGANHVLGYYNGTAWKVVV